MVKVMVFGTFDGIHKGHLSLFEQARKHGNFLIAVVARDATVLEVKGKLPSRDEKKRLEEISKHVDMAILGNQDKMQVVLENMPDTICLGYDQIHFTDLLKKTIEEKGLAIRVERLCSFMPDIYKSSKLAKR